MIKWSYFFFHLIAQSVYQNNVLKIISFICSFFFLVFCGIFFLLSYISFLFFFSSFTRCIALPEGNFCLLTNSREWPTRTVTEPGRVDSYRKPLSPLCQYIHLQHSYQILWLWLLKLRILWNSSRGNWKRQTGINTSHCWSPQVPPIRFQLLLLEIKGMLEVSR